MVPSLSSLSRQLGLRPIYLASLQTKSHLKHQYLAAPTYVDFAGQNSGNLPQVKSMKLGEIIHNHDEYFEKKTKLSEFLDGARHAFIHVNANLVRLGEEEGEFETEPVKAEAEAVKQPVTEGGPSFPAGDTATLKATEVTKEANDRPSAPSSTSSGDETIVPPGELQKCFTPEFWGELNNLGSHFRDQRKKHGADYRLTFSSVEPYLSEVIYSEEDRKLFVSLI